jgi:hypothetical protein
MRRILFAIAIATHFLSLCLCELSTTCGEREGLYSAEPISHTFIRHTGTNLLPVDMLNTRQRWR